MLYKITHQCYCAAIIGRLLSTLENRYEFKNYFIAIASFRMRLDYILSTIQNFFYYIKKVEDGTNLHLVDERHTYRTRRLAADYPFTFPAPTGGFIYIYNILKPNPS